MKIKNEEREDILKLYKNIIKEQDYLGKGGSFERTTSQPIKQNYVQNNGFIIIFAFPDYEPELEDNLKTRALSHLSKAFFNEEKPHLQQKIKMGKTGHAGCIIIKRDGQSILYEFGRYGVNETGEVKKVDLGRIAKIVNNTLSNAVEVTKIAKSKTNGNGPKLRLDAVLLSLPNPDNALRFADMNKGKKEYSFFDVDWGGKMNCGTFALECAKYGGLKLEFKCFAKPIAIINYVNTHPAKINRFQV